MFARGVEDKQKARKNRAKKAIGLAMQSRWEEAVEAKPLHPEGL